MREGVLARFACGNSQSANGGCAPTPRPLRALGGVLRSRIPGADRVGRGDIDEESGWNPYAISNKGAAGIMQLMPGTAVRFGVHNRFRVDENIHGGVAYLAWLKRRFNGDLRLITAAYYVGEYPISIRGLDYCSRDVQGYVQRVSRRYRARRIARGDMARQRQKLR